MPQMLAELMEAEVVYHTRGGARLAEQLNPETTNGGLIDAVQSSRFITERKSRQLINRLISLTSKRNADKLKRTVHITGRVKADNEKGYYIVDGINDAINAGKKKSIRIC